MKKQILFLVFLLLMMGNGLNAMRNLSMNDIQEQQNQSLWVRFLQCLLGKKVLGAYDQRTKEHRPDPYQW